MPYNYGRIFSVSPATGSILRQAYEPLTRVWRTALKGIHHTLYTSDEWNRTSPTSTNINLHSWMLNNWIAYELTMDCELIAQPHSLTFVLSNPTRTRTMAVTGCQLIWNFKAHVKTDKFVENESVNQRYWGSGGQQVRLLEPLVRVLTSELPWYWPFEVRFEGPYPFWIRVRSGQVPGSGKWSNLRPEAWAIIAFEVRETSLSKNRTEPDYGSTRLLFPDLEFAKWLC